MVSASGANPFNLTFDTVLTDSSEMNHTVIRGGDKYLWKQDVLYRICIEMRRIGVERILTEGELKSWQIIY